MDAESGTIPLSQDAGAPTIHRRGERTGGDQPRRLRERHIRKGVPVRNKSAHAIGPKGRGCAAGRPPHVRACRWMDAQRQRGLRLPLGRYTWHAHSYVALSVSVVGHANTRAGIERQVAAGDFGSTQINIDRPSPSFLPSGLVDCSAQPGVLLFGWTTLAVRASLRQDGVTRTLRRTIAPAALGLSPGALRYGSQTSTATIIQPGAAAEPLGPPPQHRECRDSTESIMYGFASGGAVTHRAP
jgi:hypothetical protein